MSDIIKCKICLKELKEKKLRSHLRQFHNTTPEEYYEKFIYKPEICKGCGGLKEKYSFISINRGCRSICRNPDCSENFICKICGEMFSIDQLKSGHFSKHLKNKHNNIDLKNYYDNYIKSDENDLPLCSVCGGKRIYNGYINFIQGYNVVCENVICETNKYKTKTKIGRRKDIPLNFRRKTKTKDHKCEVCGEIITTHFRYNSGFVEHLKEKHNISVKEYDYKYIKKIDYIKCIFCGDVFINIIYLNQHLQRVHDINTLDLKKDYYDSYLKKEGDGICVICGKATKFHNLVKGYYDTCSKECVIQQRIISYKKICMKKYGVTNFSKTKEYIEKMRKIYSSDEYKDKKSKAGKKYWRELSDDKLKMRSEKHTKTWNKKTDEEKNNIKLKRKQTILKRFGAEGYFKTETFKNKLKNKEWVKGVQSKKYETKKKNGTFKTSKPERDLLLKLQEVYGDVRSQYKTKEYPFMCDYYLPMYDLYIELNAHWTHYTEAYNPGDEKHEKVLNEWQNKNTKFYKIAIKVWTKSDVRKRRIAEGNGLNYLELWGDNIEGNLELISSRVKQITLINENTLF